jgi:hypothetical protein
VVKIAAFTVYADDGWGMGIGNIIPEKAGLQEVGCSKV